jgi:DNA adenine methylase/adenine-specific DNA-methyltransferase
VKSTSGDPATAAKDPAVAIAQAEAYPRLRYMGSKHRLVPALASVFAEIGGARALDAFSGSGVVAYALKALGFSVIANDYLTFPSVIAAATVANQAERLTEDEIATITGPAADDRDFIQRTFDGLYFTREDRQFLDSAWSHLDVLDGAKRALAIAALVLAAARKQPRGVFTVTDLRYDDGRRDLRLPLREQFRERARAYNQVVFDSGQPCQASCADVFELNPAGHDLVYLDPPYAPPSDDNCYIKRYHFLEGLAVYWRGQTILEQTRTKKLAKRHTPFSSKRTVVAALGTMFDRFRNATIVLSYSSNSVPDPATITGLLREVKGDVEVRTLDHRYSFGTHRAAQRRIATEYLFIAR